MYMYVRRLLGTHTFAKISTLTNFKTLSPDPIWGVTVLLEYQNKEIYNVVQKVKNFFNFFFLSRNVVAFY